MIYIAIGGLLLFIVALSKGMASEKIIPKTTNGNSVVTLTDIISDHSKRYNVPTALIKAVIKQESSWNVYARNPSDPSYGLMGIMPIVAQDYGIVTDWHNPTQAEIDSIYVPFNNIGCGAKLLHRLMSSHDLPTAIEMYNVGERGYEELGRRNSNYRTSVMNRYQEYLSEENNV